MCVITYTNLIHLATENVIIIQSIMHALNKSCQHISLQLSILAGVDLRGPPSWSLVCPLGLRENVHTINVL